MARSGTVVVSSEFLNAGHGFAPRPENYNNQQNYERSGQAKVYRDTTGFDMHQMNDKARS
jgi:hypothetical protein